MLIMKIQHLADGRPTNIDGKYLKGCDVDGREGRGIVYATEERSEALIFADVEDALEYWRRSSTVVPFRPDGEPNRPLTSYTVTLEPL